MDSQNTSQEHQPDNNKNVKLIKIEEPEQNSQQNHQQNENKEAYQYYYQPPRLKTDRSLLKFLLYGLITFSVYDYYCLYCVSKDINTIARPYDGKKTINYLILAFIISPLTLGIGDIVWFHFLTSRISKELKRRNFDYQFGIKDFWIWKVLFTAIPSVISFGIGIYTAICYITSYINTGSISLSSSTEIIILIISYAVALVSAVGGCVYIHKLLKSMNLLSESYNYYG